MTMEKRKNKCPFWDENYGCSISPSKDCHVCGNSVWFNSDDDGK